MDKKDLRPTPELLLSVSVKNEVAFTKPMLNDLPCAFSNKRNAAEQEESKYLKEFNIKERKCLYKYSQKNKRILASKLEIHNWILKQVANKKAFKNLMNFN